MTAATARGSYGSIARLGRGRDALMVLPPGLVTVAIWAVSHVSPTEIALHVAYQAVLVLGPGALLLAALTGERSALRLLAFGWALGLAVEVLAFVIVAALDVRAIFPLLPLLVAAGAAWRLRRGVRGAGPVIAPCVPWLLPLVMSVALVAIAATLIPYTPVPGTASPVAYDSDTLFYLSIAGDAVHHWPPANPSVAGMNLPYHVFAMAHMAAENGVTGIDLGVIITRLDALTLGLVLMLCLAATARTLGAGGAGIVLAVLITVLAGEIDLSANERFPFRGLLFEEIAADPTTLLGLVFFVAAVGLLWERLRSELRPRAALGHWAAVALVLIGAVGAKASGIPILFVGLGLLVGWRLLRERRLAVDAVAAAVLVLAVYLGAVALLYGTESAGATLRPGAGIIEMNFVASVTSAVHSEGFANVLLWIGLTVLALVGVLGAQLAGAVAGLRQTASAPTSPEAWLACLTLAGLPPFLLLRMQGEAEVYFLIVAVVPGSLLSALVLERIAWRGRSREQRAFIIGTAAAVVAFGLMATAIIGDTSNTYKPLLLATVGCIVAVAVVAIAVRLVAPRARLTLPVLAAGVLALGFSDAPLDTLPTLYRARADGAVAYPQNGRALTADVYRGLRWVRTHTPDQAELAVNNHYIDDKATDARAFMYSAFSERRIFLQSWVYAPRTFRIGLDRVYAGTLPFPGTTRLNAAAFAGVPSAVGELRRRGVDFLVADLRYPGVASARLAAQGRRIFSNPQISVYDIRSTT